MFRSAVAPARSAVAGGHGGPGRAPSRLTAWPWRALPSRSTPEVACAAAEFLRQSSWALVNHDERA